MKSIIYLKSFLHENTSLLELIFPPNDKLEQHLKTISYVHYSYQYKCYYIRNSQKSKEQLTLDLNGLANTKHLIKKRLKEKRNQLMKNTSDCTTKEVITTPIVSIVIINEKCYLKLPIPYKQDWADYLIELGCIFEPKRRFWMIPGYMNKKNILNNYFKGQGCRLKIQVKYDKKIMIHKQKNHYKSDQEVQSFIKIMTLQGASKRTIDNYASQIKKLKDYYDGKPMCEISDDEIVDYLFFLREELSYSASAQNIVVSAVKRFLLALTERELNPHHIPRPLHKKTLPKVLEKNEITAILKQNVYIKHKCMLYLLYSTGIRCGELVNLKVEDINFDNKIILINKGKGDKSRIVSLPTKLKDLLLSYLRKERPNIYLFEGQKGGRYSTTSVQKVVKNAVLKAGIDKRVTPHMLRHSFATHLHDAGMDIRNIQMLLGHTSTKTTEIYTYISKRDISQLKSPLDDLDI